MNIVVWLIFGLLVGVIANMIDPRPAKGGILGAMILGIVGALAGGFLASLFLGVGITGFNLPSFIIAIIGALIVLYAGRALSKGY